MNYLTKQQMRTYRSRLTRAKNSGDPQVIVRVVRETFAEWDAGGYAWPDQWMDWQRASDDAEYLAARQNGGW